MCALIKQSLTEETVLELIIHTVCCWGLGARNVLFYQTAGEIHCNNYSIYLLAHTHRQSQVKEWVRKKKQLGAGLPRVSGKKKFGAPMASGTNAPCDQDPREHVAWHVGEGGQLPGL